MDQLRASLRSAGRDTHEPLRRALACTPQNGEGFEILTVWYKPDRSLRVVYRLRRTSDEVDDPVVLVRFLSADPAARAGYENAPNALVLPDWDARAWVFPDDPGLPNLRYAADRGRAASLVSRLLGRHTSPEELRRRVLGYHPGKRCSVGHGTPGDGVAIVGKADSDPAEAAANHARMAALYRHVGQWLEMPRPVALDARDGVRWQTFLAGDRIEDGLDTLDLEELCDPLATALATLHGAPWDGRETQTPDSVLARIDRTVMPRVAGATPHLLDRLIELRHRLSACAPQGGPEVAIHGDLHAANILLTGSGIGLIDLDSIARGAPEIDLALFGGRLILIALNRGEGLDAAAHAVALLPDAYARATGRGISEQAFAWFMAGLLVSRQVKTCIRHWAPDVSRLVESLLDLADAILDAGRYDPSLVTACAPARAHVW